MKPIDDEIHRYWRAKSEGVYKRRPQAVVRDKAFDFLAKKQQLVDTHGENPQTQTEVDSLLDNVLVSIREILKGESQNEKRRYYK